MDAETIQGKVYYGYAQAARRVGRLHAQYRPTLAPDHLPLDPRNYQGKVYAGMTVATAAKFNFEKPALDSSVLFTCLADGTLLKVGDLLQLLPDLTQTYFIGAMDPLMPIVAVRCNALVSIRRRGAATQTPGLNGYSGPVVASETVFASGMPASIQIASAGKNTRAGDLPSDAPGPIKYEILVSPLTDPTLLTVDDFIVDDLGRRFLVSGLERTPIALRLDAVHMLA